MIVSVATSQKVKEEAHWVERSIKDRLQYTIHHIVVP
jgi:hypothetical protein